MPVNVTPEYARAEREYQKAKSTEEKIKALEVMLREMPRHKGAEGLRKNLRERMVRLKEKREKEKAKKKGFSLAVKKEGAGQVVIVGKVNVGKSSLFNRLTNGRSAVGEWEFTTTKPEVGMMDYTGVKIQVVDMPALIEGCSRKQGELLAIVRNADLVVWMRGERDEFLGKEFEKSGIMLGKERPPIRIKKTFQGGINFVGEGFIKKMDKEKIKEILRDKGLIKGVVEIFGEVKERDFKEVMEEGKVYLPVIEVKIPNNKHQIPNKFQILNSNDQKGIREEIWEKLGLMRIYTKEPGKKVRGGEPIALKKGSLLREVARVIHKDFLKKFRFARVWGKSVRFEGMRVGLGHRLEDGDVVEVHLS